MQTHHETRPMNIVPNPQAEINKFILILQKTNQFEKEYLKNLFEACPDSGNSIAIADYINLINDCIKQSGDILNSFLNVLKTVHNGSNKYLLYSVLVTRSDQIIKIIEHEIHGHNAIQYTAIAMDPFYLELVTTKYAQITTKISFYAHHLSRIDTRLRLDTSGKIALTTKDIPPEVAQFMAFLRTCNPKKVKNAPKTQEKSTYLATIFSKCTNSTNSNEIDNYIRQIQDHIKQSNNFVNCFLSVLDTITKPAHKYIMYSVLATRNDLIINYIKHALEGGKRQLYSQAQMDPDYIKLIDRNRDNILSTPRFIPKDLNGITTKLDNEIIRSNGNTAGNNLSEIPQIQRPVKHTEKPASVDATALESAPPYIMTLNTTASEERFKTFINLVSKAPRLASKFMKFILQGLPGCNNQSGNIVDYMLSINYHITINYPVTDHFAQYSRVLKHLQSNPELYIRTLTLLGADKSSLEKIVQKNIEPAQQNKKLYEYRSLSYIPAFKTMLGKNLEAISSHLEQGDKNTLVKILKAPANPVPMKNLSKKKIRPEIQTEAPTDLYTQATEIAQNTDEKRSYELAFDITFSETRPAHTMDTYAEMPPRKKAYIEEPMAETPAEMETALPQKKQVDVEMEFDISQYDDDFAEIPINSALSILPEQDRSVDYSRFLLFKTPLEKEIDEIKDVLEKNGW